jgi:MarR family transcriptional regulator for hemolysin
MLEHDFESSIGFWVFTAAHAMESAMNEALAPLGITGRQCQILACLAVHGEVTQNELAERLRVEPSSVVRMLDRMERDDWIERRVDPEDRRRRIVRPTERAEPIWRSIRDRMMPLRERGLRGIAPQDLALAQNVLRQMCENLAADIPPEIEEKIRGGCPPDLTVHRNRERNGQHEA